MDDDVDEELYLELVEKVEMLPHIEADEEDDEPIDLVLVDDVVSNEFLSLAIQQLADTI